MQMTETPSIKATMEHIGMMVIVERARRKLARSTLAFRAGIDTMTLYRVENGQPCSVATLCKIADALDVPLVDLLPYTTYPEVANAQED